MDVLLFQPTNFNFSLQKVTENSYAESTLKYLHKYFNPNLGGEWWGGGGGKGGGVGVILPPSWFSLHNSETVKAVTLEFCSIQ